ncbi:DUF6602 domain-containing protein [Sphingobium yanoikuyae]|nr:DUF6602 domain-containing protein [Sphingobium yanoikuyae]
MQQVTDEMASEYQRIFERTTEDPGTAGDEGEENWATLFREWLPPNYQVVTKGRLLASNGAMSPQIDVIVLKPFYPKKLQEKKVWLADGVAAAFECKTTLKAEHISASIDRCKIFKSLFSKRIGTPEKELHSPLIYGILAHSHAWKSEKSNPARNVTSALSTNLKKVDHPSNLIDVVCLSDVGCWTAFRMPFYNAEWNPAAKHELETLFGGTWGVSAGMSAATDASGAPFTPIGAMLGYLTQRMAWNDAAIRDLADYHRLAGLWGSGGGQMRQWPQSVYSTEVIKGINQGKITNAGWNWNEWGMVL